MLLVLAVLVVGVGASRIAFAFVTVDPLSDAQRELVDTFGYPSQFSVAYVPDGPEDDQVVARYEIWYYPDHGQKVMFLRGVLAAIEEMPVDADAVTYPLLRPEQFHIDLEFAEIAELAGPEVELVESIPAEDGVAELYAGEQALFAIERDRLVFIQTIGVVEGG